MIDLFTVTVRNNEEGRTQDQQQRVPVIVSIVDGSFFTRLSFNRLSLSLFYLAFILYSFLHLFICRLFDFLPLSLTLRHYRELELFL